MKCNSLACHIQEAINVAAGKIQVSIWPIVVAAKE